VKIFKLFLLVLTLLSGNKTRSQPIEKIKFQKNQERIYFFKTGARSDTLFKNTSHFFYLMVPDSLRPRFSLLVDNGRLMPAGSDSLLKFEYLPGLKYETFYVKTAALQNTGKQGEGVASQELSTLINGSTDKPKNMIVIRISDKKEEKALLENIFYYR
jgi:hypothetical protein